jgi:hypothetical protein
MKVFSQIILGLFLFLENPKMVQEEGNFTKLFCIMQEIKMW